MTNDSAVAAQPVLASILSHQRKSYVSTWVSACASDEKPVKTARQLLTGIKSLDDYLSGAFTYGGGIVSIANEGGRGSSFPSMLFHHILTSHILPPHRQHVRTVASPAYVIDTTGDFSPILLHRLLQDRLRDYHVQQCAQDETHVVPTVEDLHAAAASLMDHVSVLRAFDWAGLVESVDEVRDAISSSISASTMAASGPADQPHPAAAPAAPASPPAIPPLKVIPDSQASTPDSDMLSWPATPPPAPALPSINPPNPLTHLSSPPQPLLLLSSLPRHISTQMHTSHIRGHANLLALLRTLRHISQHVSRPFVVVGNSTVAAEASPSAFADVQLKPALGRSYAAMVDHSVMVTRQKGWDRTGRRAWLAEGVGGGRTDGEWSVVWECADGGLS